MPGASPEASDQSSVAAAAALPFFLLLPSGCGSAVSFVVLTTDQPPADVADAVAATCSAGVTGSAGRGAGVHAGSLGAGIGAGSGAGRNGSGCGGVYAGSGAAGGESEAWDLARAARGTFPGVAGRAP